MNLSVESLLIIHSITIGLLLLAIAIILYRRGLFKWTSAGFWAWAAFLLYFVLNPLLSILEGDYFDYQIQLEISGGVFRGLWIMFVVIVGISLFFAAYLKTTYRPVNWGLHPRPEWIRPGQILLLLPFIAFGAYALITYRADVSNLQDIVVEGGRFIGNITAYEYQGHILLIVPILMALFSTIKVQRLIGWVGAGLFVILALPNGRSRFVILSFLIAVAMVDALRRNTLRPRLLFIAIVFLGAAILQIRGHEHWSLNTVSGEISSTITQLPENITELASSQDSAMLATFYLESYVKEKITGFDYQIPLLNYALTGWIPSRIFPDKYFMIDWLRDLQPPVSSPIIINWLYGAKSSLFGDFYANGGVLGVVLGAILAGYLSRRLDGFLAEGNSILMKSIGVSWMSVLWMVWGSNEIWGFTLLGFMLLPAIPLWLFGRRVTRNQYVDYRDSMMAVSPQNTELL